MSDQETRVKEILTESEFGEMTPAVNANAEFFEIAHDFGDAPELVREAIAVSPSACFPCDFEKSVSILK